VRRNPGKAKAVNEENNTSWEAAMNEEKSMGKTKLSSKEKSATKTAIEGKIKSTDKTAVADNEKRAVKGTTVNKDKPAVKIAPEKITRSTVDNKSTATTNKATATADNATVKSTSKVTSTTKKATAGSASGKKLAKLTPAEINRVAYTKTINSSKSKASHKLRKGIGIELSQPLAFKYAILLDVPIEKMIDDKLLQVLDYWYGTRYRFGGESRKGIDCSAFTQAFMLNYFEYELPRRAEEQYAKCKHIKKKKLRQGDLVFFKTHGPKGGITHVGVYLVNSRFVHSSSSTGVRISNLNEDYYTEHYAGGGRIR
jgi:lipoprotein Spr